MANDTEKVFDNQQPNKEEGATDGSLNSSGEGALKPGPNAGRGNGRLPAELRAWVLEQVPEDHLLRSLDELNGQECLELSQFLDFNELERAVASEQARRQR